MLIAVGYWKLILTPINDDIDALRQQPPPSRTPSFKAPRLPTSHRMKSELETVLADPNAKPPAGL